jgi:asparagine synthase (glutamine-hydrolysing)
MCGFAGFIDASGSSEPSGRREVLQRMGDALRHRGPDDLGIWQAPELGAGLVHRRLAILDLSPEGGQPMLCAGGRHVLVFNGEIYNHLQLRRELEREGGIRWRGRSDTETLLAGFELWGVRRTLEKSVGMFALALLDREEGSLTLARDRMGEKPLYYGFIDGRLLFASELKALQAHPGFRGEVDRHALCLYLRHCYLPTPFSIYRGIKKLPAASILKLPVPLRESAFEAAAPAPYWELAEVARRGVLSPFRGSDAEAVDHLDALIGEAVGQQMVADVPLGAFLSGGIDSSTVVSIMQSRSSRPITTFSIGSDQPRFNEAEHAKRVARHLGTEHTERYVSSDEAMQVVPKLGRIYDEPFADSSQIPTFLVSEMARRRVTVSLSGDAGDELFCGYNRYLLADTWGRLARIPFALRRSAGSLLGLFGSGCGDQMLPASRLAAAAARLSKVDSVSDFYFSLVSELSAPERLVLDGREPASWLRGKGREQALADPKLQLMYLDCMTYLPDDILVKVDRAAMANSLETRIPFLDHRVVEFAWSLPVSMKLRAAQSKWILKQVLHRYVPRELIERPKMGFGVPFGSWIREGLRDWAEALLDESRLRREGFFDAALVRGLWQEHLAGKSNAQNLLWSLLMFQVWLEEQHQLPNLKAA